MKKSEVGKVVPNFTLPATGNKNISLKDFKGKKLVIYFYPKDNTPGCTQESKDFRDKIRSFSQHNAKVIGISRDSVKSHEGFKDKKKLPFPLLSDSEEIACEIFDVIQKKSMFGKTFLGIQRSTFLIDEKSVLRKEWRKVKVSGHIEEVLSAVKEI